MKFSLFLAAIVSLSLSGCTLTAQQKEKWSATGSAVGSLIAEKALKIAEQAVISYATSASDGRTKADFLDSAAAGLRANMGSIVSSEDVAAVVRIWTPAAEGPPHWEDLAGKLAASYAKNQRTGTSQQVVEQLAEGLQLAAASERQP
jgi:hypothetical protein